MNWSRSTIFLFVSLCFAPVALFFASRTAAHPYIFGFVKAVAPLQLQAGCDLDEYLCVFNNWSTLLALYEISCNAPLSGELLTKGNNRRLVYELLTAKWCHGESAVIGHFAGASGIPSMVPGSPIPSRAMKKVLPKTVVSSSPRTNRTEMIERFRRTIGDEILEVLDFYSFGTAKELLEQKDRVARLMFTNATYLTEETVKKSMLSTMNALDIIEDLALGSNEEVLYLEDDAMPIIGIRHRLYDFLSQVADVQFDIAFLGTCFDFNAGFPPGGSPRKISSAAWYVATTRCFNAVLLRKSAAIKIARAGPVLNHTGHLITCSMNSFHC